jgi:hypothetical protein
METYSAEMNHLPLEKRAKLDYDAPGAIDVKLLESHLEAPDEVGFHRRKVRDITERQRALDLILWQYHNTVLPAARQYLLPSKVLRRSRAGKQRGPANRGEEPARSHREPARCRRGAITVSRLKRSLFPVLGRILRRFTNVYTPKPHAICE